MQRCRGREVREWRGSTKGKYQNEDLVFPFADQLSIIYLDLPFLSRLSLFVPPPLLRSSLFFNIPFIASMNISAHVFSYISIRLCLYLLICHLLAHPTQHDKAQEDDEL